MIIRTEPKEDKSSTIQNGDTDIDYGYDEEYDNEALLELRRLEKSFLYDDDNSSLGSFDGR